MTETLSHTIDPAVDTPELFDCLIQMLNRLVWKDFVQLPIRIEVRREGDLSLVSVSAGVPTCSEGGMKQLELLKIIANAIPSLYPYWVGEIRVFKEQAADHA